VLPLITAAIRSPFAAAGDVLAGWHPVDLAALVVNQALDLSGLRPDQIDQVWLGCDEPVGAQGANVARAVVLAAGWPDTVSARVVDVNPVSGMAALEAGGLAIRAGAAQNVMVIGLGCASVVQPGASALNRAYGRPWGTQPAERYQQAGGLLPPFQVADREALELGADRSVLAGWVAGSISRRLAAQADPVPWILPVGARPGEAVAVQRGVPVARDVIRRVDGVVANDGVVADGPSGVFSEDGLTTAASLAPVADGVSVVVLSAEADHALGVVRAVEIGAGSLLATVPAARRAQSLIATATGDASVDRWDVAEPTASVAWVAARALGIPEDDAKRAGSRMALNPDGGTLAVGDAGAAEDLRLIVDGLARAQPGTVGAAVRSSAGVAGICVWERQ
jgi:acetyl-CoA acetyltransferase